MFEACPAQFFFDFQSISIFVIMPLTKSKNTQRSFLTLRGLTTKVVILKCFYSAKVFILEVSITNSKVL